MARHHHRRRWDCLPIWHHCILAPVWFSQQALGSSRHFTSVKRPLLTRPARRPCHVADVMRVRRRERPGRSPDHFSCPSGATSVAGLDNTCGPPCNRSPTELVGLATRDRQASPPWQPCGDAWASIRRGTGALDWQFWAQGPRCALWRVHIDEPKDPPIALRTVGLGYIGCPSWYLLAVHLLHFACWTGSLLVTQSAPSVYISEHRPFLAVGRHLPCAPDDPLAISNLWRLRCCAVSVLLSAAHCLAARRTALGRSALFQWLHIWRSSSETWAVRPRDSTPRERRRPRRCQLKLW